MAGVTVSWLARLEQGKAHAVSADVLDALARVLRLEDAERAHLFALAGLRSDRQDTPQRTIPSSLLDLLAALDPNPAYLLDRAWNMTAWNESEAALYPGLSRFRGSPPNLLQVVFRDEALRSLMVDHEEEVVRLVSQFRLHRSDWPDEPEIAELIERLLATSSEFARLWAARDVAPFVTTRRVFDHPRAGRLEFDHHRMALLDRPGEQLVVYLPVAGSDSATRLRDSRQ
jgi:transcriptional regulator with XRE-family HTH domain